jgi:hypothetical protein
MQHHKLDFRNKKHLEQISICERLVAGANALPEAKRQNVRLEELRGQTAAARASHERIASLRSELKAEITNRKALLAAARTAATSVAFGLALNANYQPAEMQVAGLELAAPNTAPVGVPDAPTNLRAVPTDNEGEAQLRWQRTIRRCSFEVQWHADPPDADHWHSEGICFPQKMLVQGLVSGAKYWFRVRAGNAHGHSAWSQLASVRVK